jgi:hypothetical protein
MGSLVHTGLGSSSLVAHVLPYPPPPCKQLCTRSCSNKHTHNKHTPVQTGISAIPDLVEAGKWSVGVTLTAGGGGGGEKGVLGRTDSASLRYGLLPDTHSAEYMAKTFPGL